jgi:hypothetical protein
MKYLMLWSDALTFHHDLPFIPLHYIYAPFTSSSQFTSLYLTSLYCTSFHFTSLHLTSLHCSFGWFSPHLHFAVFMTFLALFVKWLDLQESVLDCFLNDVHKIFSSSIICSFPNPLSLLRDSNWLARVYCVYYFITVFLRNIQMNAEICI